MDRFTTEAFTLLAFGLFFIFFRLYTRVHTLGWSGIKADDLLMIVAALAYSAETALAYTVGSRWHGLANNAMTEAERAALDPSSLEYRLRVGGSKTQVAGWSTYTFLLWTLKASMCAFYLRLLKGLDYHMRIYIGFVIIFTSWVTVLLSILLGCRPMSKNWQIYPNPGNYCQPAISRIDIFVTVVLNVITDVYLLSIPVPMLWAANLRPTKKAGLIVLFSGGAFVTIAGVLRCVLILTNPVTGASQAGSWAVRETFVAVVTSNAPIIFPLIRRWCIPIFGSMHSAASANGGRQRNTRPSKKSGSGSGSGGGSGSGSGVITGFSGSGVLGLGALSSKLGFGSGGHGHNSGVGGGGESRGFSNSIGVSAGVFVLEDDIAGEHERQHERDIADSSASRQRRGSLVPKITFTETEEQIYFDAVVIDDEEKQHNQQQQQQQQQYRQQVQSQEYQQQQPQRVQQKRRTKLRVEEFQMTEPRPSTEQPYVTALSPPRGGIRVSMELTQQQQEEEDDEMQRQQVRACGSDTSADDDLDKVLYNPGVRASASYYLTSHAARAASGASSSGGSSVGAFDVASAATMASPLTTPSWYSTGSTLVGASASDNKRGSMMLGRSQKE